MTNSSTTIRVSTDQRDRLRTLAEQRAASMTDTLDAALEALRRQQFYADMNQAEIRLRSDPVAWDEYVKERDVWLDHDLSVS